jgi:hypothetical protein
LSNSNNSARNRGRLPRCSKTRVVYAVFPAKMECVPDASENRYGSNGKQPWNPALSSLAETMIIPLTEQKAQTVAASGATPPTLVDPHTQTTCVLIRKDLHKRLTGVEYDDTPWTAETRDALAWEAGKHAGWEDMGEYDDDLAKP